MAGKSVQSLRRIDVDVSSGPWWDEAAELLRNGGIVAFPTETVYGLAACPTAPGALEKLDAVKGRPAGKPYSVLLAGRDGLGDFVGDPPWPARVLARKGWPGPITLIVKVDPDQADRAANRFGDAVRILYTDDRIGLRCPDHPAARTLVSACSLPVVAPSANPSGAGPACDADAVCAYFSANDIDLVLDAGPSQYRRSSTVVLAERGGIKTLRAGPLDADAIDRLARFTILFVCTGNTCRSPMAEALTRRTLAERLGCGERGLGDLKISIVSAGIIAGLGRPPTAEAIEAVTPFGLDIRGQKSQPATAELIRQADIIYVMGEEHKDFVGKVVPEASNRVKLLDRTGQAVADPLGLSLSVYANCARRLDGLIRDRLREWFQ